MKLSGAGTSLLHDVRWAVLSALDTHGPSTVAELPRRWPVTKVVVRHVVDELAAEGWVEPASGAGVRGHTGWRITPLGRSRLCRSLEKGSTPRAGVLWMPG